MRLSMALRRVTKLSEDLAILAYVAIDQLLLGGYGGGVVVQDLPAPRGVFHENGEEPGGVTVVAFSVQVITSVDFCPS